MEVVYILKLKQMLKQTEAEVDRIKFNDIYMIVDCIRTE